MAGLLFIREFRDCTHEETANASLCNSQKPAIPTTKFN